VIAVDLIVRSDALVKGGGDMVQVAKYIENLPSAQFDVRVVPFHPTMKLRPGVVVHIVNVDRPFDFVLASKKAQANRLPVVVSPIHHDLRAVRRMRSAEEGLGLRSILGRLLPESGREWIATGMRSVKMRSSWLDLISIAGIMAAQARHLRRVWSEVGDKLDQAQCVLLLAPGEGRSLTRDTGWSVKNDVLVPNGSPAKIRATTRREWQDRDIDLIVVGRVEPRKRTLELARYAANQGRRLTIVGPLLAPDTAFGEAFQAVLRDSPLLTWTGPVAEDAVLELMGRSKVLVNASWVEVQSLVELEAAHLGCYVVSSGTGNTSDWIPASAVSTGADSIPDLLEKAEQLRALAEGPSEVEYPYTWESVSRQVGEAYRVAFEARTK
jgi:glycosyltransferase involved in cell wall biosynthesis